MTSQKQSYNQLNGIDPASQKLIIKWFSIRSLSPSTQGVYLIYIKQFLKFHDETLYDFYTTSYKEQENNTPMTVRQINNQILEYKFYLDNSQYSDSTITLKIKVILSFCKALDLEYPRIRLKRSICESKNYERPLTKEELLLMLNTSPLREQAFLSLQATTGMGSKEVRTLTLHDLFLCVNKECGTHYTHLAELFQNKEEILGHDVFELNIVRKKSVTDTSHTQQMNVSKDYFVISNTGTIIPILS